MPKYIGRMQNTVLGIKMNLDLIIVRLKCELKYQFFLKSVFDETNTNEKRLMQGVQFDSKIC